MTRQFFLKRWADMRIFHRNLSLKFKLLLPICGLFFLSYALSIAIIATHSVRTAKKEAFEKTSQMAFQQAGRIVTQINLAADKSRALASLFSTLKTEDALPSREVLSEVLKTYLLENEGLLGVWNVWEPNAVDDRDHEFVNAPGHDETGRFIAYWNRVGGIHLEPAVDYRDEGRQGLYYWRPMETGRETIIDPTTYRIGGKMVEVVSITAPILDSGVPVGVVGVDFSMDSLKRMVSTIRPFGPGYAFLMTNAGEVVAHPRKEEVGAKPFRSRRALDAIRRGESLTFVDGVDAGAEYTVIAPIPVENIDTPWSLALKVPMPAVLADATTLRNWIISIGVVSFLVLIVVFYAIVDRMLSRPISRAVKRIRAIAEGDASLEATLDIQTRDEMGDLARAFNEMAQKLQGVMESLRSERDYSRDIIHISPGPIFGMKPDGTMTFINPAGERITGYGSGEVGGKVWSEVFAPVRGTDEFNYLLSSSRRTDIFNCEMEVRARNGERYTVLWNFTQRRNRSGEAVEIIGFGNDITRRRSAEKEKLTLETRLRQAQKMEAIGNLAGGIAHDFNNILSPILGFTELSIQHIPKDNPSYGYLFEIHRAASRARELVRQILTFCRQSNPERKPVNLRLVVREVTKLLEPSFPRNINIRADLPKNRELVLGDPAQLHQIVMNLCTNAKHAMSNSGGLLTLSLDETTVSGDDPTLPASLKPGNYMVLTVRDTGSGIPPEALDRIFEPYFTTKSETEGTGMGLSIVYGIVKDYGGDIRVHSVVGKGTEFRVYLPSAAAEERKPREMPLAPPLPCGTERILLVDDENPVARMIATMLGELGYKVEVRFHSGEALDLFQKAPDRFDLVITDLNMPEMDGIDLSRRVLELSPEMPIILCSGYLDEERIASLKDCGIRTFITKPFGKPKLANLIRDIFDGKAPEEETEDGGGRKKRLHPV